MTLILLAVHILAATTWVGGMFFAHFFLRPAARTLEMEQRITLWFNVLSRFFSWIWGVVIALPLSGYALLFTVFGGLEHAGPHIVIMQFLGWTMIILFAFLFFSCFRKMTRMVKRRLIPEAAIYLDHIRILVSINLLLGIGTMAIAATGRYW